MVCLKMLVLLVLTLGATIQPLDAQTVFLHALDLPLAAHYVTYFAEGVETQAVGRFRLPLCSPYKNGSFVGIKSQKNVSVAFRAPISRSRGDSWLLWNFTAFPVLTPRLSGVYRCYTSTKYSTRTYKINVVVEPSLTCRQNSSFSYNSPKSITCLVRGNPQPVVTWTGYSDGNVTDSPPFLDGGVVNFNTTLTILASAKMAAGVEMTVNITAKLPAHPCTPGVDASVQAKCQNMSQSATRMLAFTISRGVRTQNTVTSGNRTVENHDATTTRPSPSSSPTSDHLTARQTPHSASHAVRPTSETTSVWRSTADVQGFETAMLGTSLWLPIAIAFPVLVAAIAISIVVAKNRRDRLRTKSYSCRQLARARAATRNDAYEDAGRIDIRATGNPAYQLRASAPRQPGIRAPGNTGVVVYEDAEIMENTTRSAAYTLTSVPNQPNYEFVL